ncbi:MAG: hypothetical protein K8I27_10525 [Planctomycetes bacterium]|nr:hypothetical protein [Planctomycetota bacterium]
MKLLNLMCALFVVLVFAACGGHDHDGNGEHNHGNDDNHGHDHDDHSGEKHPIGQVDLSDGYRLEIAHIGPAEASKEVIFEIVVKKDGTAIKDASVTIWVGDESGTEATPAEEVKWSSDENLYDGHLMMPKTMPEDAHLWVRIRHDGKDMKKEFELKDHDHE